MSKTLSITVIDPPVVEDIPETHDWSEYVDDHWPVYTLRVSIGAWSVDVRGWAFCGRLGAGAHADIDGAGLAVWGGTRTWSEWRVLDTDGQFSGLPRVDYAAGHSSLRLHGGDNLGEEHEVPYAVWRTLAADGSEAARILSEALADAAPMVPDPRSGPTPEGR